MHEVCRMTGKAMYATAVEAHRVADAHRKRQRTTTRHDRRPPQRPYRCAECGGYHLTAAPSRRGAGRPR